MNQSFLGIFLVIASLALPMLGQSKWAENSLKQGLQGAEAPYSLLLVYFGEQDRIGELQVLVRTPEIVEFQLKFRILGSASESARTVQRQLSLNPSSIWAIANSQGYMLLQGDKFPNAETIIHGLESKKISSPVETLRNFIKANPNHLSAKILLLRQLRKQAEIKTAELLKLEVKTSEELFQNQEEEYAYRRLSNKYNIDTSAFGNKKLEESKDLAIWGAYAQELDNLFNSGEWRQVQIMEPVNQIPVEVCSPLMKLVYKRLLPQVLLALQEWPNSGSLWKLYSWMRGVTGSQQSMPQVIAMLNPTPGNEINWPPKAAYSLFIEECIKQNNWKQLADSLWNKRHGIIYSLYPFWKLPPDNAVLSPQMKDFIQPLLEALIRTNRIEDAEYLIANVAKFKFFSDFVIQATELAIKCDRVIWQQDGQNSK
ncbi:MAG: hypothetical protein FWG02_00360 [Holophagaceae bacterium]|nr:hypothetical protein [Holophagaceae bacterium]